MEHEERTFFCNLNFGVSICEHSNQDQIRSKKLSLVGVLSLSFCHLSRNDYSVHLSWDSRVQPLNLKHTIIILLVHNKICTSTDGIFYLFTFYRIECIESFVDIRVPSWQLTKALFHTIMIYVWHKQKSERSFVCSLVRSLDFYAQHLTLHLSLK